jgi:pimeloyl-ACP methyl ester carboxylesterase
MWRNLYLASCLAIESASCFVVARVDLRAGEPLVQSSDVQPKTESASVIDAPWNVPLKTAGGTQLWTDHVWRNGYRIQRNALTSHWRLIDPKDVRRAWGSREHCLKTLDELSPITPETGPKHYVILLHGLMRTSHSMSLLAESLQATGDYEAVSLTYASSRESIASHAAAVREVIEALPADASFSFVGHSMGNIVTRCLIGDLQRDGDPKRILPRCRSMVMLGPPNQGASIARCLAPTKVFGWVTGPGGMELGANWNTISDRLATPPFPFMIIAGETKVAGVDNPLVEGKGDFVVSLDEARLDSAERIETVPVLHSF